MEITHAYKGMRVTPTKYAMEHVPRISVLTGDTLMPKRCLYGTVVVPRHEEHDRYKSYKNIMKIQWDNCHDSTWWYDASLIQPASTGEF